MAQAGSPPWTFGRARCWTPSPNSPAGSRSVEQHLYVNLVDDAVRSRQHRKNILDPHMTYVGVGLAIHKALGTVCVMNFSHDWQYVVCMGVCGHFRLARMHPHPPHAAAVLFLGVAGGVLPHAAACSPT